MMHEDDVEAYIESFKRIAIQMGLDQLQWASQLGSLVVGKAQAAYRALRRKDAYDYDYNKKVKKRNYCNGSNWLFKLWERTLNLAETEVKVLKQLSSPLGTGPADRVVSSIVSPALLSHLSPSKSIIPIQKSLLSSCKINSSASV
ncbi:hypothetical protein Y1Q_0008179 [Alligator mississippiensis]|uniref:Uncharacterized protein n=1 Tax=Alligator mississippiensis TaxID=8496 RepID=A0A151N168_ALLMI|nr:hypothetical protein Y1Q_0008179 [Alligator mississippiensis]